MPGLVRNCLFAAALLATALAGTPTYAEMTKADKAGIQAFAACLDENGGGEEACIEKLGRFAWYPRNDASCESIATRVNKTISRGDQAEWTDLFLNERCTRLGMPHDREAAKGGDSYNPNNPIMFCLKQPIPRSDCENQFGRHTMGPIKEGYCDGAYALYVQAIDMGGKPLWSILFYVERCLRLGQLQLTEK